MPNYQERAIYLDESDNVCHFGEPCEINLVFNLDGDLSGRNLQPPHIWSPANDNSEVDCGEPRQNQRKFKNCVIFGYGKIQ